MKKQIVAWPDGNFIDMHTDLDDFGIKIMELINETYDNGDLPGYLNMSIFVRMSKKVATSNCVLR